MPDSLHNPLNEKGRDNLRNNLRCFPLIINAFIKIPKLMFVFFYNKVWSRNGKVNPREKKTKKKIYQNKNKTDAFYDGVYFFSFSKF